MESGSAGFAAAFRWKQTRGESGSRVSGRLVTVHPGRLTLDGETLATKREAAPGALAVSRLLRVIRAAALAPRRRARRSEAATATGLREAVGVVLAPAEAEVRIEGLLIRLADRARRWGDQLGQAGDRRLIVTGAPVPEAQVAALVGEQNRVAEQALSSHWKPQQPVQPSRPSAARQRDSRPAARAGRQPGHAYGMEHPAPHHAQSRPARRRPPPPPRLQRRSSASSSRPERTTSSATGPPCSFPPKRAVSSVRPTRSSTAPLAESGQRLRSFPSPAEALLIAQSSTRGAPGPPHEAIARPDGLRTL
jgi:hypothetical protein